jgi:integrase
VDEKTKALIGSGVLSCSAAMDVQLNEIAKLAGISVHLTTHVAHHTFARLADSRVANKRKISAALGHSKFSTTEVYLEQLRMSDLDDDMAVVYE